jgi:ATP-dependent DNA helicase RecQ
MIFPENLQQLKFQTLKYFWGYEHFRDLQEEIIDNVISGNDTLVLLPTGGGKSLCYQLPALMLDGTCLVISPLLALMKDQVSQLKNNGIEAEYLSSELDEFDSETIYNRCKEGFTKLLYVSPERLTNSQFLQNIEEIKISFIAVDEAHCISEWGQDFRPSYQNIKAFRNQFKKVSCLALTATATPKVLNEIQQKLDLKNPKIFQKSFRRSNISIFSEQVSDKYQKVFDRLKFNQNSGIIYARTRKETEELSAFLQKKGIKNVDFFHAGLPPKEKHKKQNIWINSNSNILISTNAFGMGIDKENVRFVIHFSPPASIENYYQEIGRTGRDGLESYAFLLWNEQEISNFDDILRYSIPNKKEFCSIISYLYSIFQIAENDLPEQIFQLEIQRIRNFTKSSLAKIRNVLNFLHNQEVIFLNNLKSLSSLALKIAPEDLDSLPKKDAYFLEILFRNLPGITSHKVMFSEQHLSQKIGAEVQLIKEKIKEMQQKKYLDYIDGALASIRFLKNRDDRIIQGKYWKLFEQIQKNRLQKWEEMKFYTQNSDFCKMKLILSYFGEKNAKNCGKCSVCEKKKEKMFGSRISDDILNILTVKPATAEEISSSLYFCTKEKILENLIFLLDSGKIKMLDFKTYSLV